MHVLFLCLHELMAFKTGALFWDTLVAPYLYSSAPGIPDEAIRFRDIAINILHSHNTLPAWGHQI